MTEPDLSALYRTDATEEEVIVAFQHLIDTGDAWRLEGSIGRAAMAMIENGDCVLGIVGHRDIVGNYIPSRDEVRPGTKGSVEYAERMKAERDGER